MTIRITSWNVNGYRAMLKKGLREWMESQGPDILCLQEIKVKPEQLTEDQLPAASYPSRFWNPAEKPGYSGVATFSRRQPLSTQVGLGVDEFDREGRVLATDFPLFRLWNVYFPNGQRGQERVDFKLAFYEKLLERAQAVRAEGSELIITGDYNTAHTEIDLARPEENRKTSGFLQVERDMVSRYLATGLVDIFRTFYPERVQYTYWDYVTGARARNVGWRIDYFLVTPGLVPRISAAVIHDEVMGSDHCPLSIEINEN